MPNPVNWFEIPVADLDRARRFYQAVFDYEMPLQEMGPLKMAWFPMERNGQNATGSLVKAESYIPSHQGSMVYLSVDDVAVTLKKIVPNGGTVVNPKSSIGEFGFVGHFEDTEGNRVGLHSDR